MGQMKKLFEPTQVGAVELKNRVVMLGITTGLGDEYRVTERLTNFFGDIAKGGTALVTIGSVYPSNYSSTKPRYKPSALGLGIWSDEFIPGLSALAKAIHDNGAKSACQLALCYEWGFIEAMVANADLSVRDVRFGYWAGDPYESEYEQDILVLTKGKPDEEEKGNSLYKL
jgi:2,4-dienoyl-CoA reductase (NADPH2)